MLTQNTRGLPETSVDEGATTILDDTYLYDDNGNVREIVDGLPGALGTRTMTYDGLDRLLTVTAGSAQGGNAQFGYDVLDNITRLDQGTRTLRHQYATATNRLTGVKNAAGSTLFTVTHDVRGNQTSRTTGGVTDTFTFDRANRLKASNVGGTEAAYRYDGLGRRMQHTEGGVGSFFQYSQSGQMLFSQDGTNRFDHVYLSGSLVAKRVVPYGSTTSTRRFQHTDALGSPVAETDEVGALIGRERMTAYGEPADGTWTEGPGFTGHHMDATAKLVYMQQRYYDPAIGRFLSVDPISTNPANGAMFNRYSYANNSPYRFTDPDGRCPKGAEKTDCIESTVTLDGGRANVRMSAADDDFATSNALAQRVKSTGAGSESFTAVVLDDNGNHATRPMTDVKKSKSIAGESASGRLPKGTPRFIAHGHKRNSQLDQEAGGDSGSVLNNSLPNVTIENRDVGAREIEGGRLQHRMLRGQMTETEADAVQARMDEQARAYNNTH